MRRLLSGNSTASNRFSILFLAAILPWAIAVSVSSTRAGDIRPGEMVSLTLVFQNKVGEKMLVPDKEDYTNASGETFRISLVQYFISNIQLQNVDGSIYTIPQDSSYFLVNQLDTATQTIRLRIPAGEYNGVSFLLGIDSLRNTVPIGKRHGVLDPGQSMDNGMYWGWNSGYIFFKMEGSSAAAPADPKGQHKFRYHIGGFGGYSAPTINNIKPISLKLSSDGIARAGKEKNPKVYLQADLLKVFTGVADVSIAAHPSVMFSDYSVNIANNYSHMFSHARTEN